MVTQGREFQIAGNKCQGLVLKSQSTMVSQKELDIKQVVGWWERLCGFQHIHCKGYGR